MLSESIGRAAAAIAERLARREPIDPMLVELLLDLMAQWRADAAALESAGRPAALPDRALPPGANVVPLRPGRPPHEARRP